MVDATLQSCNLLGAARVCCSFLSSRQARRLQLVVQLAVASACAAAQRRRFAAQTHEFFFFFLFRVPVLALSGHFDPCWAPGGAVGLHFGSKRKSKNAKKILPCCGERQRTQISLLPLLCAPPASSQTHARQPGATTRNSTEAARQLAAELHFQRRSHELINADARPGVTLGRLVYGDGDFGALLSMPPKQLFGRDEPRQQSLKTLPSTWISIYTTKPNFLSSWRPKTTVMTVMTTTVFEPCQGRDDKKRMEKKAVSLLCSHGSSTST
ncbi:hypothetical protein GGI35DRAFT_376633 [Trichoderma velutinum]